MEPEDLLNARVRALEALLTEVLRRDPDLDAAAQALPERTAQ